MLKCMSKELPKSHMSTIQALDRAEATFTNARLEDLNAWFQSQAKPEVKGQQIIVRGHVTAEVWVPEDSDGFKR